MDDISRFIYENRIGIYRNAEDAEGIKRYLSNIQERFPAEAIFVIHRSDSICGWCALDRDNDTIAELGRWQPIIEKSDNEDKIANLIMQGIIDYAARKGITRIESMFNGVDSDIIDDYERSAKWFKSNDFPMLEDNAYLTMPLDERELETRTFPDGFAMESVKTIDENELYQCYYDSFVTGEDRDFLDQNDEQRRAKFDKSLHNDTINHQLSTVLKEGEKIVGFSFIVTRDNEEHIDRFGVLKGYRGKGLAKTHLLKVLSLAKESGTPLMSIGVDTCNTGAYNLYKNVGFEVNTRTTIHVWNSDR